MHLQSGAGFDARLMIPFPLLYCTLAERDTLACSIDRTSGKRRRTQRGSTFASDPAKLNGNPVWLMKWYSIAFLVVFIAGTVVLWGERFWEKKEHTRWIEKEVLQIMNKSPGPLAWN